MATEFSKLKPLLTATALIEALTGLVLLAVPSLVVSVLLGTTITEQSGILLARMCGAALIALAIACWIARNNAVASVVMTKAFVFYNSAAASLLIYATVFLGFSSFGLWAAILLHTGMFVWCIINLLKKTL